MDEFLWVVGGLALICAIFQAGRQFERGELRKKAGERELREHELGVLGSIASMLATGQLGPEEAGAEVRRCEHIYPDIFSRWAAMSEDERIQLGNDMLELMSNPGYVARHERRAAELRKAMREMQDFPGSSIAG